MTRQPKRPQVINQPPVSMATKIAEQYQKMTPHDMHGYSCRIELFEQAHASIGFSLAKKINERHPDLLGTCYQETTENEKGISTIIEIKVHIPYLWHRLYTLVHSQTPSQGLEFLSSICLIFDINLFPTSQILLGRLTLADKYVSTFCQVKRIKNGFGAGIKYTFYTPAVKTLPFSREVERFMEFVNSVPLSTPAEGGFITTTLTKSHRGENVQLIMKETPAHVVPDLQATFYPYKKGSLPSYRFLASALHSRFSAFVYQSEPLLADNQEAYIALYQSLGLYLTMYLKFLNIHLSPSLNQH